jgi:hypothetical protein
VQPSTNTDTTETISENKPFEGKYEKYYVPSDWLKARGLSEETLKVFGVGQYNNPARKSMYTGKVLFPIKYARDPKDLFLSPRSIDTVFHVCSQNFAGFLVWREVGCLASFPQWAA